jgi:hypothetical protein
MTVMRSLRLGESSPRRIVVVASGIYACSQPSRLPLAAAPAVWLPIRLPVASSAGSASGPNMAEGP